MPPKSMSPKTVWTYNFIGWLLFTFSALAFLWGTWKAGDTVGIIASLFFLVACIVFLVPVWANRPGKDG